MWRHPALTPDATAIMLMRHDCVGDYGIGDGPKAWGDCRNAPETVRELDDVCNVCALAKITKIAVPRVTQAEEKPERVFTDVMGPFRVAVLQCVCRLVCGVSVCELA